MQALLRNFMRATVKQVMGPPFPIGFQRKATALLSRLNLVKRRTAYDEISLRGVPGRLIYADNASDQSILYLHGGAYCLGSPGTHRAMLSHLAARSAARIYLPDYRLAPEHPYPAALRDALSCYEGLLQQGVDPVNITIAGDSAGGGLALATAMAIRNQGLPMPAAMVLISPWTDLSLSGQSFNTHQARDPILRRNWLDQCSGWYCDQFDRRDPGISPLFGDHRGLPPTLVQVGSDEVLLDDSVRLESALRDAGNAIRFHCYDGMWHVFQLHAGMLPEADQALDEISNFMRQPQTCQDVAGLCP